MNIKSVTDSEFSAYGKPVTGYDTGAVVNTLNNSTPKPSDAVVYVPDDPSLGALPVCREFQLNFFGGMPIQTGYCNGFNQMLNCLEYHRSSELIVAADDVVLLLAKQQDIAAYAIDTDKVEAFLMKKGLAVELYATTLHYAPCNAPGGTGFRVAIILPKGTNTDVPDIQVKDDEDKLLLARNKWLLAHPDSPEAADGAFIGLKGENIRL